MLSDRARSRMGQFALVWPVDIAQPGQPSSSNAASAEKKVLQCRGRKNHNLKLRLRMNSSVLKKLFRNTVYPKLSLGATERVRSEIAQNGPQS
eukprot:2454657-Amphidinium_carterae.1